jgi:hypothetical protein
MIYLLPSSYWAFLIQLFSENLTVEYRGDYMRRKMKWSKGFRI